MTADFESASLGSIPSRTLFIGMYVNFYIYINMRYGYDVMTADFESASLGSIPSRT